MMKMRATMSEAEVNFNCISVGGFIILNQLPVFGSHWIYRLGNILMPRDYSTIGNQPLHMLCRCICTKL